MAKDKDSLLWLRPKNDFIFKLIFGSDNEQSKELLLAFLNDLLDVPVGQSLVAVEILDPTFNKQALEDKLSILDVRARVIGYGFIDVEIQLTNQKNIDKRSLYYASKLFEEQLGEGDEYHKLNRVVAINIVDFSYFTMENYKCCYRLMEEKTGEPFPDLLQLHFIELPKFMQLEKNKMIEANDRLAKWVRFISNEDDLRWEEMAKMDPMIAKAVNILKAASLDPKTRMLYEAREKALKDLNSIRGEGYREGIEIGIEQGIEQGRLEEKFHMARKLLAKGNGIEDVAEITELSLSDVKKILDEMNDR